jgi:tyrosinase
MVGFNTEEPSIVHTTDLTTGLVPTRREVRDLKNNFPDQWNVYMLGLRSFQMSEQSDPLSYYAIAG